MLRIIILLSAVFFSSLQAAASVAAVVPAAHAYRVEGNWIAVVLTRHFSSVAITATSGCDFVEYEGVYWAKCPDPEISLFLVECDGERCRITDCTIPVELNVTLPLEFTPPQEVNTPGGVFTSCAAITAYIAVLLICLIAFYLREPSHAKKV